MSIALKFTKDFSFYRTALPFGGNLSWKIHFTEGEVTGLSNFNITKINPDPQLKKTDMEAMIEEVVVSILR